MQPDKKALVEALLKQHPCKVNPNMISHRNDPAVRAKIAHAKETFSHANTESLRKFLKGE